MVSVVDGFGKPGSDFKHISGKHLYLVGLMWNMTLMVVLRAELGRDKAEENRPNSLNGHPRTLPRWISMRKQHFVVLKLGHVGSTVSHSQMVTLCLQNIPQQYLELHFVAGEEPGTLCPSSTRPRNSRPLSTPRSGDHGACASGDL